MHWAESLFVVFRLVFRPARNQKRPHRLNLFEAQKALPVMFGKFPRHDNRKLRISRWFARERDGDMQAFDLHGVADCFGIYFQALRRDRVLRRATQASPAPSA